MKNNMMNGSKLSQSGVSVANPTKSVPMRSAEDVHNMASKGGKVVGVEGSIADGHKKMSVSKDMFSQSAKMNGIKKR